MSKSGIASALFVGVLVASVSSGKHAAAEQPARAGGAGVQEFTFNDTGQPGREQLAFSAVRHADGTVTGEGQVTVWAGNTILFFFHMRVDCMLFNNEFGVIVGGVDVFDSDPEFVGSTVVFAVRDNGEGAGAPPDTRTGPGFSQDPDLPFNDCELVKELADAGFFGPPDELHFPIIAGNYQVRP